MTGPLRRPAERSRASGSTAREKVYFDSGDTPCAAWYYPGVNGACVIMAHGLPVTKEPATDRFAKGFHEAGFSVLAFDYRRFGESGGKPRQVARIRDEYADLQAAIDFAPSLPEVDAARLAIWASHSPAATSSRHLAQPATRNSRPRSPCPQTQTGSPPPATRYATQPSARSSA